MEVEILSEIYSFIVIGSGVVGNAVARELTKYTIEGEDKINVAVLEKELDVCCETSARNSGVLHAGFNNKVGSKMAKLCVEGNLEFDRIAEELDIPFKRTGKVVVGFTDDDKERLIKMKELGDENGCPGLEIIDKNRIKELCPNIEGEFAMFSPMTGVLNPFEYTIALAENAHKNGVEYFFGNEVKNIKRENGIYDLKTNNGEFKCKWIINCAGLNSDKVAKMIGINDYTIFPCRGEYFILDKKVGNLLNIPAYPVPNPKAGGLGIHLTPSVDGNVLIGPSSEYINDNDDYAVTQPTMDMLIEEGSKIFPYIKKEDFIRNFVGIRPKLTSKEKGGYGDFVIERREEAPNSINLVGIESPGLTSALPIAREVIRLIKEVVDLKDNKDFNPIRKGHLKFAEQPIVIQKELIEENRDYGEIICRCESITKAEIIEAINNPLGVETITGIKYRCRSMMGRCQGGYCQTRITELLMQEKDKKREEVIYSRSGGNMFTGKVRE